MRTYRFLLIGGLGLWLVGLAVSGVGSPAGGARLAWYGQLLAIVGAAGVATVWVVRQVVQRRLRPPGRPGGEA